MDITITKEVFEQAKDEFIEFGMREDLFESYYRSSSSIVIDVARYSQSRLESLLDILSAIDKKKPRQKHVTIGIKSIKFVLDVFGKEDADAIVPNLKALVPLLRTFFDYDGHRVYRQRDGRFDTYYVDGIEYHKEVREKYGYTPPFVSLSLKYREMGSDCHSSVRFYADVTGHRVGDVLRSQNLFRETDELRDAYISTRDIFTDTIAHVGRQLVVTGSGELADHDRWSKSSFDFVESRVVVDVMPESDRREQLDVGSYWDTSIMTAKQKGRGRDEKDIRLGKKEDESDGDDVDDDDDEKKLKLSEAKKRDEVPIRPTIRVFDLTKHEFFNVDVRNTKPYEYDKTMSDKLILPERSKSLINMLCSHRQQFTDIVRRKGGGSAVLCAGPPGVGKTLTAEVYAESMEKPLYSVQCSQLGLSPQSLEKSLLEVFARAERWGAILLLDEADVYISERGRDLQQNAIVGVFLRVLEYYSGILFMTTNRVDIVDDAIMSRCLARIVYEIPTIEDQLRIWTVLADVMGIPLSERTKQQIVKTEGWSKCSGRDIKNTLRLAQLVAKAKGEKEPSMTTLKFCFEFRT